MQLLNRTHYFLLLAAVYSANGAPDRYEVVPSANSHFALEVYKTGLMAGKKHHFEFKRYRGDLGFDSGHPEMTHLRLAIDAQSIENQDDWVKPKDVAKIQDYAVRDMLDAQHSPQIIFESTQVTAEGDQRYAMRGRLTIRGRSNPVAVEVRKATDSDSSRLRFTGEAVVKLTDYGLKPPTAALGAIGTKDQMTVIFDLTAARHQ